MSDNIVSFSDGPEWKVSSSFDTVHCKTCGNKVKTPEEYSTYPDGNCTICGNAWLGSENRSTTVMVTAPDAISGEA